MKTCVLLIILRTKLTIIIEEIEASYLHTIVIECVPATYEELF